MGNYEGEYVKAPPNPAIYLVEGGKRIALRSSRDWFACGLRPLNNISAEELEQIPYSHTFDEEPPEDEDEEDDRQAEPIVTGAQDEGFLTVVTRHTVGREDLFAVCQESLNTQTDQDFQHLIITDSVGRGIAWSHQQFAVYAELVNGEYVFILDDDDRVVVDDFVSSIKQKAGPALFVVRMDHGYEVLPTDDDWGRGCPALGHIGISAVVVQRDVWIEAVNAFTEEYAGDYPFVARCFELAGDDIVWIDRVISECQRAPL